MNIKAEKRGEYTFNYFAFANWPYHMNLRLNVFLYIIRIQHNEYFFMRHPSEMTRVLMKSISNVCTKVIENKFFRRQDFLTMNLVYLLLRQY